MPIKTVKRVNVVTQGLNGRRNQRRRGRLFANYYALLTGHASVSMSLVTKNLLVWSQTPELIHLSFS